MKVSLATAQKHSNVPLLSGPVDDLVEKIGAQLGAVEGFWKSGAKYDKVVVAKVITCEKHPNADKLSVCTIDDGGNTPDVNRDESGYVTVVCGAPNVRADINVAWIPPGAVVPSTFWGDQFTLEARELRGVVSNGMLASASELAISDDHAGILEILPEEVGEDLCIPGTPFVKLYDLDDITIDIENKMFTHRPDCFGVLGVAREIAGIQGLKFESPDWYWKVPTFQEASELDLEVVNQLQELVPRFMAVAVKDITIKPSPVWMQALLTRVGMKPINNIVDITNYLSYLTGQPLHAYDYDKVASMSEGKAKLIVRHPREGESIALLNGKNITPRAEAIMIATDTELVGIGGVMGGTTTEVDASTRNVIIEVASFDMYSIRRTSMAHGLFTDAVTRFNKGQSPLQNDRVIAKALELVREIAGGSQASRVIDEQGLGTPYDEQSLSGSLIVRTSFINERLGLDLTDEIIGEILRNVNFACYAESPGELNITAPFWRTDIEIAEDIVEEVGRLYGYDKLPHGLPKRTITPVSISEELRLKSHLRRTMASFGANEILTYSFVHGNLLQKVGQNPDEAFRVTNALSPDLQYYRLSMIPSTLAHVHSNIKAGHDDVLLFELGKVHHSAIKDETGLPRELGRLSFVVAHKKAEQPTYYEAAHFASLLLPSDVQLIPFDQEVLSANPAAIQMAKPFEPSRSALYKKGDFIVGIVGEFTQSARKALKLPDYSAGFEIFLSALKQSTDSTYQPLSKFPSISQDICLQVDENLSYGDLTAKFEALLYEDRAASQSVEYQPIDIYTAEDLEGLKRITYRVTLTSLERTLTEDVMSSLLQRVVDQLGQTIRVERI